MLADRNINRPSYVVALLLGLVALADAGNALVGMQAIDPCAGLSSVSSFNCGSNAGWLVDLMTSGICATLVALLLLRPHLFVFAPTVAWAFLAFMANFIMKSRGFDGLATFRMAVYFVVFVGAGVVLVIDGQTWLAMKWARRPMAQPMMGQLWAGQPYPGQYAVPPPQFAPPPVPPAAPVDPPAAPAAPHAAHPAARDK
jgi:hypothetical protein